jgi:hypothetical protein
MYAVSSLRPDGADEDEQAGDAPGPPKSLPHARFLLPA